MNDAKPTCGWNESAPSFPGKDCQCEAYSESECGFDADWTPSEVYKLRKERDEAREALRELYFAVQRKLTECAPANDINAPGESPLPLEVIPNHMGINLCSVESLEWTRQADGQLASLTIAFIPANVSNNV